MWEGMTRTNGSQQVIQQIIECDDEIAADEMLKTLFEMAGCIGGRVLPDTPAKPGWKAQVFFVDDTNGTDPLCDGMRRVVILDSQRVLMGIHEGR